jgi:hypothetical protein
VATPRLDYNRRVLFTRLLSNQLRFHFASYLVGDRCWGARLRCPGRTRPSPRGEPIPFGPSHAAFLISNPDKNEGGVIASCFRPSEHRRHSICVPDSCFVGHRDFLTSLLRGLGRNSLNLKDYGGSDQHDVNSGRSDLVLAAWNVGELRLQPRFLSLQRLNGPFKGQHVLWLGENW